MAVALVAILVSAGMVLVIGEGLKLVIDAGFTSGNEAVLDATLATLAALIAVLGAVTWIRVYNVYWVGARFTADLRRKIYEHLVMLSPAFYEETRTGEVASRVTNDVTLVEAVMGGTLLYALRMTVTMLGCVRDALLHEHEARRAGARLRAAWCCCPSGCSACACAGSRARCRTAWPT